MKLLKYLFVLILLILNFLVLNAQTPSIVTVGTNSAIIKWTKVTGATQYWTKWTSDSQWDTTAYTPDTFLTINNLNPNRTYRFVVRKNLPAPTGNFSSPELLFSVSSGSGSTCNIPNVNLFGTYNLTSTSFKADWNDVPGATSYILRLKIRNTTSVWSNIGTSLISELNITNLTPNTQYEWQVSSVCPTGSSAYSASGWTNTLNGTPPPPPPTGNIPHPDHIVIVIEENHGYTQIVGSPSAPNFNALINGGNSALFTQSYALTHPSQPNYLMLFSGSNQGITDDACPVGPFSTPSIFSVLGALGKAYKAYSETLPGTGSTVCSFGGNLGYWRKHAPWVNFSNINHNNEVPMTLFPTDFTTLPYLSFVIPNQLHDWHDGTLAQMDDYLGTSGIMNYANWAKTHNSLLIVTFDEDDGGQSNRIPTVFVGQSVLNGSYSQGINHYNVLGLLTDMAIGSRIGASTSSTPIDFCWTSTPAMHSIQGNQYLKKELISTEYYNILGQGLGSDYSKLPLEQLLFEVQKYKDSLNVTKFIKNK
jgi:acid phosphatase